MEPIRISKYFTDCGVMSRRAADTAVENGEVKVNGIMAVLGQKVTPGVDSVTWRGKKIEPPAQRRSGNGKWLTVRGARENNLKNIDVSIPLGTLTCVTGVSGSGKSSLVNEIIFKKLGADLNRMKAYAGKHDAIEGKEHLDKVIAIDQSPIGRTPRSNPATYTSLFNDIRDLFASLPEAKRRGKAPRLRPRAILLQYQGRTL